jgi:hypothetical protein
LNCLLALILYSIFFSLFRFPEVIKYKIKLENKKMHVTMYVQGIACL